MTTMSDYKGVAGVTAGYFVVHTMFVGLQGMVQGHLKKTIGDSFDRHTTTHPMMRMADRSLGNMLEQMVPFLFGLWMQALFIDIRAAEVLGTIVVATRMCYPFWYSFQGKLTLYVVFGCTLYGYLVNTYFTASILLLAIFDTNLRDECSDTTFPFAIIGVALGGLTLFLGLAKLLSILCLAVFPEVRERVE